MSGWSFAGEPAAVGSASVTLVGGSSFCVCEQSGDVRSGSPQGVFYRDTRIVSAWRVSIDGEAIESLAVLSDEPWRATFLGRAAPRPGRTGSTLLLRRDRYVGRGMREDIALDNLGGEPAAVRVSVRCDADFADLFEVKESRVPDRPPPRASLLHDGIELVRDYRAAGERCGVVVSSEGATVTRDGLHFDAVVPSRGRWTCCVQVVPVLGDRALPPCFPTDQPVSETAPARRARAWRESVPVVQTEDAALARTLARTRVDLGALRIHDGERPDVAVVAAGAPWFMTLFGRDSLLTSYMALSIDQGLALGTLQALARLQGKEDDPASEEQPGRILHEVRFGADPSLALGGRSVYYGTVDATPLFVILLGELRRWGMAEEHVDQLMPHAERALEWIVDRGDRDGDLFVEHQRATGHGLVNQGWKDSLDGVTFADATVARGPIALCEVQGYAYAAYLARADFAREAGDEPARRSWADRAAELKRAFNETFWLPDKGWYALALDGRKRPVDALASNMGHCLWTGIVDEDRAPAVVERLLSPELFSGWGIRTLATTMGAYNPLSYHNGSVWPHDNALIAAGLMRYGFVEEAQRVAVAILDAADAFGGRLPELFCGFDRSAYGRPVPCPTSCSPQAWASATPVQLLRTLLRFDPLVPQGRAWLAPALPDRFADLTIRHVPIAGSRVSLTVKGGQITALDGVPAGLEVLTEPRPPAGDGLLG
ncbi:MAG: glycogen debranching N-terminal domain-containing protein [Frankiaceae bacterium]